MQIDLSIGQSLNYALQDALLIYRADHAGLFITRHAVELDKQGTASLGPANLVDLSFLRTMLTELNGTLPLEILPANVLARTVDSICWWVPAATRVMYYMKERSPELSALSGSVFPQPALLFEAKDRSLRVRALAANKRPDAGTKLFRAPYWNVNDGGQVCLGSTRTPEQATLESIARWETSFFESEFTHANGQHRLTNHSKGFAALWSELKCVKAFPPEYLADTDQTLEQFLRAEIRNTTF